jgi:RHS repeat-associated protein
LLPARPLLTRRTHWRNRRPLRRRASGRSVYNYFRDYDAFTGRYIQSDPIGLEGGLNTYLYANANPLRYVDQYGLQSGAEAILLPGLGGGGAAAGSGAAAGGAAGAGAAAGAGTAALGALGVGAAAAAGYGAGTLAYPLIEPLLSPVIDAVCREDAACDREWEDAYRQCSKFLASPSPPRGVTGGYSSLYDCARGLVSQACGGNAIDYGRGRSSAAGRGRGR